MRSFTYQLVEPLHIHLPEATVGNQQINPKAVASDVRQSPVTLKINILSNVTTESLLFMKTGVKLGARELKLFIVGGKATCISC